MIHTYAPQFLVMLLLIASQPLSKENAAMDSTSSVISTDALTVLLIVRVYYRTHPFLVRVRHSRLLFIQFVQVMLLCDHMIFHIINTRPKNVHVIMNTWIDMPQQTSSNKLCNFIELLLSLIHAILNIFDFLSAM